MRGLPPDRMQPAEIVAEIGSLCRELQAKLAQIQHLSDGLYRQVRRSPLDDNTSIYVRYANSWARSAGMASQLVRRASTNDRVLRGLVPRGNPAESIGKPAIKQARVAATPVESLLDMYSEDSAIPQPDGVADRPVTEAE